MEYDADLDSFKGVDRNDPRLTGHDLFPEPVVHTVFGDSYLLLCFLEKCGIVSVLRNTFDRNEDYERVLCHILHSILKNGSRISCDDFLEKSFASYVLNDIPIETLGSDTGYFRMMGNDHTRLSFFRNFVQQMRQTYPSFGKGCYVDSTPLPNDIRNNPFNALCSHGIASTSIQTRLALVLDIETGLPVWYQIVPGNVLDFSTIMTVMSDVAESLDIRIDEVVLDAGYVSRELLEEFNTDADPGKKMIARMPNKKGYPYMSLYTSVRKLLSIQNLGIEIQRAKNKHKVRSVVLLVIAIANVFLSIPLIKLFGPAGAALGTAITLSGGNVIFMNWYYYKRLNIDIKYFWKNILSIMHGLLIPSAAGVLFRLFIHFNSLGKLALFIIIYIVIYAGSMYCFGMNEYEKELAVGMLHRKAKT